MKKKLELILNGEIISFYSSDIPNLFILLEKKVPDFNKKSIAVAVNKNLIRKKEWISFKLKPNDIIEIVSPFPGGWVYDIR